MRVRVHITLARNFCLTYFVKYYILYAVETNCLLLKIFSRYAVGG